MNKQQNLAIEYCGSRLNVSSAAVYDHISTQPDGTYCMNFRGSNGHIAITISPLSHYLLQQSLHPQAICHGQTANMAWINTLRFPCELIRDIEDRQVQIFLREIQAEELIDFMWIMSDARIIQKLVDNCSYRAGTMLMDDLTKKWHGKKPDQASKEALQMGVDALMTVARILDEIIDTEILNKHIRSQS
mgnify:FL=1